MIFDASRWAHRINEELSSVWTVIQLYEHRAALEFALERQQAIDEDLLRRELALVCEKVLGDYRSTDPELYAEYAKFYSIETPEDAKARARDLSLRALMKGYETFRRQVVVLAVTYVELITEDFLKCVFIHRPSSMYNYLNQWADQKGKIDLKEVLDAESKEALLDSLALRSARIASQGKFRVLAKNIESITHRKFQAELVSRIEAMIERRNRLVHEDSRDQVSEADARNALFAALELATDLGRTAIECGIPATPYILRHPLDDPEANLVTINCWFAIDGQLSGSQRPGSFGEGQGISDGVDAWISDVRHLSIKSIICLLDTEQLDLYKELPTTLPDYYQKAGFHVRHIPSEGRQHPPLTAEHLSEIWLAYQELPKPVLVHCCDDCDRTAMAISHIQEQLSRA